MNQTIIQILQLILTIIILFLFIYIAKFVRDTFESKKSNEKTIKVGLLYSLTGTIRISEKSVIDAELMAINGVNSKGGVNIKGEKI